MGWGVPEVVEEGVEVVVPDGLVAIGAAQPDCLAESHAPLESSND